MEINHDKQVWAVICIEGYANAISSAEYYFVKAFDTKHEAEDYADKCYYEMVDEYHKDTDNSYEFFDSINMVTRNGVKTFRYIVAGA